MATNNKYVEQGQSAAEAGESRDSCPYAKGEYGHRSWMVGWDSVKERLLKEAKAQTGLGIARSIVRGVLDATATKGRPKY